MDGNWLRSKREALGISQEELATRLQLNGQDVSRASISGWEHGRYHPPLENRTFRRALAISLGISMSDLLRAAGYEIADDSRSPAARLAADIVDEMQPEDQELALRLLAVVQQRKH